jgi:hypothetical protein
LIDGVPCLDFGFDVNLAIRAELWLKPGKVIIDGYEFDQPLVQQPVKMRVGEKIVDLTSYIAPLRKPLFLGYYSRVLSTDELTPDGLGYQFWQTVPCVLVQGLLEGNSEPEGSTITAAYEGWTDYRIDDFDEELKIPDSFAQYLKDIGSWDSLADRGIINSKLVITIKKAIERLKVDKIPEPCLSDNDDVVSALVALGWRQAEAKREVKTTNFSSDLTLEDKVKLILLKSHNQQV